MGLDSGLGELPSDGSDRAELSARVLRLEQQMAELQAELRRARAVPPPPMAQALGRRPIFARAGNTPVGPLPGQAMPSMAATQVRGKDLESEFGAKVVSKIAVVLLLVGAAFFLKWAVDNHWIGPAGRVVTGLLAGAGLIVWSERFRKTGTPAFSYALKAVGSGVLYLSLWAGFQLYHLVPGGVAFAAMLLVTVWNMTMALTQDSRLLAGYALLGAYLTPALISTGGDHQVFLFLYLATVAAGLAVLLRQRAWNVLLLAALPATTVYCCLWYVQHYNRVVESRTLVLSLILWAVFSAIPLVAKSADDALAGVLQPIGTALFGALTVYSVLVDSGDRSWEPWAAIAFAVAYLALSRVKAGTVVAAIHLSLALSFLTIAVPLKATGHGITIGWLAETLALLWIATLPAMDARSRTALQWLALAAMLLGTGGALLGSSFFGWSEHAFLNREFATALGAVVVLVASMLLWHRMPASTDRAPAKAGVEGLAFLLLNVVLLVAMHREIGLAMRGSEGVEFAYSAWMALQGAAVLAVGFWLRKAPVRWMGLLLLSATLLKTVFYDMRNLSSGFRVVSYLALGALLMGVSYAYQKDLLGLQKALAEEHEEAGA